MISFFRSWRERLHGLQSSTFGLFRTDLSSLMASAAKAQTLGERIQWVEELLNWIRIQSSPDSSRVVSQIQAVRVKFFLQSLERNPEWKKATSQLLVSLLLETEAVSLLGESGLTTGDGFFSEASERFMHRILPSPRDEKELAELFSRIFHHESDADWLQKIDESTLQGILALLFFDPGSRPKIERHYMLALSESLIILSAHLESLGLSREIRLRSQVLSVRESCFYRLRLAISTCMEQGQPMDFRPLFQGCREEIASALAHLEERGVSVAIVYRLEKMERHLERMESIVAVYFESPGLPRTEAWMKLLSDLVRSERQSNQLHTLVQHNLHMLARKIVERTGASGEHYITSTKKEYFSMLLSAAGGGVLTVGTAVMKFLIGHAGVALFFEGFFSWVNYSGSFMLMQATHLTLATKQPSMTAPALAAQLKESKDSNAFAELVARITRSQFAAALGNIGLAVPGAYITDFLYFRTVGSHLFPVDYAQKTIDSLHPFHSGTIPYAALTGILLWVASIGAGWGENWFVYRRLPETISQSLWLGRIFGPKRAQKISAWICKNISGIGGNISLGFLLAFTPISGRFFGLPLDVRHVTLSTAALTFSFCAKPEVNTREIVMGAISIFLVGVLNFGVSFVAALYTAVKARELKKSRLALVRQSVWVKFRRSPMEFLFPWSQNQK